MRRELVAGDRLSVPAIAAALGVSRSPIREAVQRLLGEGLATEVPHRGAVVARYGPGELAEMYQVREVLEGLAARLATERGDTDLVEALDAAWRDHERAVRSGEQDRHVAEDVRFHALIREAAGDAWLEQLLTQVRGKIRIAMLTTSVGGGRERALEDHRRVLEAVRSRDARAAEQAMRDHIARLRDELRCSAEVSGDEGRREVDP